MLSELNRGEIKTLDLYNKEQQLMINMLYASIWNKTPKHWDLLMKSKQ